MPRRRESRPVASAPIVLERSLILACGVPVRIRTQLVDVASTTADLVVHQSFAALRRSVSTDARRTVAIVLAARDATGADAVPFIRELTAMRLGVPIVAVSRSGNAHSSEIRRLAAAGAHELLFDDTDDAAPAIRRIIQSASHECAAEAVMRQLRPHIPTRLHPFVDCCLGRASSKSLEHIANNLGVHRATLGRYCELDGMPTPMELYAWCRLMLAAYFLERPVLTVETISTEVDFASVSSFHNMLRRYVGLRASEVWARGGLSCVVGHLWPRSRSEVRPPSRRFRARHSAGSSAPYNRSSRNFGVIPWSHVESMVIRSVTINNPTPINSAPDTRDTQTMAPRIR